MLGAEKTEKLDPSFSICAILGFSKEHGVLFLPQPECTARTKEQNGDRLLHRHS